MSSDFKDQLKQQADIVRIVGDYVQLRKSGAQNYSGLCPFHKEKTASFSVHATKQFFYCFGCHAKGDVFEFVQKVENITFGEAVRFIAQKLGVPMPKVQYDSPAEQLQAQLRMQLVDINERACAWFQEQMRKPEGANAREYLTGRGLTQEVLSKFRIGFAPESGFLLRDALRGHFDEEVMRESGLFSWKQDDRTQESSAQKPASLYSKFRNRVMFPICNDQGRVIAFTGRTLATDEKAGPKYLNSPETHIYVKSRVLFNLDKAKEAIRQLDYALLVEGQMDCVSVYAAGFHNVIASSGTAFTDLQARLLGRFSHRIVVNFDPDTAGAAAAERSLGLLVEEDFEIKVVTLESGFDPDLFIRKKGAQEYAAKLKSAPKYFDYLIERAQMKFPVRTPEGKVKAVNFLLPHIQRVPSRIARDELSNEISQKLGIDSAVLR
jgi:DNA primase